MRKSVLNQNIKILQVTNHLLRICTNDAEEVEKEYLASAVEENTVFSNLAEWEEVEKNKA